jgi:hypothetical protein
MTEETPVTLTLSEYVKAPVADTWADQCRREATAIVDRRIGTRAESVPLEVRSRAILEVGAELYYRRDTLAGNAQMNDDGTAQPRRVRNPERIAADILDAFLNPGIY